MGRRGLTTGTTMAFQPEVKSAQWEMPREEGGVRVAVMFSSPKMIAMFILGVIIIAVFSGAILVAIVQTARGKFKVDYDRMAQEAIQAHLQAKRSKG